MAVDRSIPDRTAQRIASQIVAQLPESPADARSVLKYVEVILTALEQSEEVKKPILRAVGSESFQPQ